MTVRTYNLKTMLPSLLVPVATGALATLISGTGIASYSSLARPPLSPQPWVFTVVWTILYIMMGYAAYIISSARGYDKEEAYRAYYIQLALNFIWPIIFFRFKLYTLSVFVLMGLIVAVVVTIMRFWKVDKKAAIILVPYLVWLFFALYLNIGVAVLN